MKVLEQDADKADSLYTSIRMDLKGARTWKLIHTAKTLALQKRTLYFVPIAF